MVTPGRITFLIYDFILNVLLNNKFGMSEPVTIAHLHNL